LTVLSLKKTALPKLSGFKHQNEIEMTGKERFTSEFNASNTAPGTGSGQNSSGVKLQSIRLTKGRPIDGHTFET
jgi:hypothetical protein